jgi:2-dehydrotetronate isomerase
MKAPVLAANLKWLFSEWPLLERFQAASKCGFRAVELSLPYDHAPALIQGLLHEHRLAFVYMLSPPGDWDAGERGLAALPGREREFRKGMRQAVQYASALGKPFIHPPLGNYPVGSDPLECAATLKDNLRWAARLAAESDLRLVLEPICRRDHPRYPLNTVAQGLNLIAEVGAANMGLMLDFHHTQWEEGVTSSDVLNALRAALPRLWHVQIALAPDRNGPDEVEFDLHTIIAEVARLGYAGVFSCEYRPHPDTLGSLAWAKRYGVSAAFEDSHAISRR